MRRQLKHGGSYDTISSYYDYYIFMLDYAGNMVYKVFEETDCLNSQTDQSEVRQIRRKTPLLMTYEPTPRCSRVNGLYPSQTEDTSQRGG